MKQLGLFAVIMLLCGVLFGCTAVKSRDASGTEPAPTAEVLQPTEEAPSSDPAAQPVTETPTEEPEKSTEIDDPTEEPISEKPEYPYLDIEDVLSSPVSPYAAHVFSHQGTAKEECSETFAAYDLAILYGSRCLEQDLVISSDGILYCSHDLSPERLTGEQRQFSEMTSREIDALRTETGNLCIPRLSAVFARYGKAVT